MDTQELIETLKAEIAQLEAELADLESDILDIELEMKAFTDRYRRMVQPLQTKLDLLRDTIDELEKQRNLPPEEPPSGSRWTTWTPPADYVSVEEQYRQTWQIPKERAARMQAAPEPPPLPAADDPAKQDLKSLYRQLARRFHPDLSTDPAESEHRNRLMAEINAAYAERNLDALRVLAAQPADAQIEMPIAVLQLRQLEQIRAQLHRRLGELRFRRNELFHGDLMDLKIQTSLAARRGRDLLQEMADQLERDYRASLDRLDDLRGMV